MKIILTDTEVRVAIQRYVRQTYVDDIEKVIAPGDVHVLRITRHHGGGVTAEIKVDII